MDTKNKTTAIKKAFEKVSQEVERARINVSPLYTRDADLVKTYFDAVIGIILIASDSKIEIAKSLYRVLHTNGQIHKLDVKIDEVCDRSSELAILSLAMTMISHASDIVIEKRSESFAFENVLAAAEAISRAGGNQTPDDIFNAFNSAVEMMAVENKTSVK